MTLLLLVGCIDQNFSHRKLDAIAVSLGDFDAMGDVLVGADVPITEYDGYIVQAVTDPADDRRQRGEMALDIEGLLTDTADGGGLEVNMYNAVFVNSGTRGLGAFQYNEGLVADDGILTDETMLDHACSFADNGGTLVVSDWGYDLVEACWPDAVEFVGDDAVVDAAQTGKADGQGVAATIEDEAAAEKLGDGFAAVYDYSAWAVIEDVGADTEVLVRGTVEYQPSADKGYTVLSDAPLMVRFAANRGQVVFTTFHWTAQNPTVARELMLATVEGLGSAADDDDDDTGEGEEE